MLQPSRDLRQGGLAGVGGRQNILLETEGMRKEMRIWGGGQKGGSGWSVKENKSNFKKKKKTRTKHLKIK